MGHALRPSPGGLVFALLGCACLAACDGELPHGPASGGSGGSVDAGGAGGMAGSPDTGGAGGSGGSENTGGGDPGLEIVPVEDCGRRDLLKAQPAVLWRGVPAVPVDIDTLEATIVLDASAGSAEAQAKVAFTMGGAAGYPVLDFRQKQIEELLLDGAPVDPLLFPAVDFGGGPGAQLRVLEAEVEACAQSAIDVSYRLLKPVAAEAADIEWDPAAARVRWNLTTTDFVPGRFLEAWVPENLMHDQHPITLDVEVAGTAVPHTVITNASVEVLADGSHWRLTLPPTSNTMSPMLLVLPADEVESFTGSVALPDGQTVALELHRRADEDLNLEALAQEVASAFLEFSQTTGPYLHGDRFTAFLQKELPASMEYDGAAISTPGALKHEVFHSWYARGIRPARGADGWIDEAWDTYNTHPSSSFSSKPLDLSATPLVLCDDNPWTRTMPASSYNGGAAVFAVLAGVMTVDELRAHMSAFYEAHPLGSVTTQELERHLACASGHEAEVRAIFHRFVFGREDAPPEPDPAYCARLP